MTSRLLSLRQTGKCGRLRTPLLLRLNPPFLFLTIPPSRTHRRTVRLVIATNDLRGAATLRENVVKVAPLPTVDVKAVLVLVTMVTRQTPHTTRSGRHIKQERNCAEMSSRALGEASTDRRESTKMDTA